MNKKFSAIILLVLLFLLAGCSTTSGLDYYGLKTNNFISADTQLWGRAWASEIKYDDVDIEIPECDKVVAAGKSAACIQKLNIKKRGELYPKTDKDAYRKYIPDGNNNIDYVLIAIKLKAWAMENKSYCQITAKFADEENYLDQANFVNHAEVYGDKDWILSGRKISYVVIPMSVKNNSFFIKLQREILGKCEVSIAINVLGFYGFNDK